MDYPIRTSTQLEPILKAFRKNKGLSQIDLANLLGVSQQALSSLENAPQRASFDRLLSVLAALGVEVVLRDKSSSADNAPTGW